MLIEKSAQDFYEGVIRPLMDSGQFDIAEKKLNSALENKPNDPIGLHYLAAIACSKNLNAKGILLEKAALEINADFADGWSNLGCMYRRIGRFEEAEDSFKRAVKLRNDDSAFISNLAAVYVARGKPQEAEDCCVRALELNPENESAKNNLSLSYLERGNYGPGFDLYPARKVFEPTMVRSYTMNRKTPTWTGEDNCTVVIYGEQGIGDELMFATLLPEIIENKNINIILDCHPRLVKLFRKTFGLETYATRKDLRISWNIRKQDKIDYCIAMGDLCSIYRRELSSFPGLPYLLVDPELEKKYKMKGLNIGISWSGGTIVTGKEERTFPIEYLNPIFESIDANWHSLQYTPEASSDVDNYNKNNKFYINHDQEMIDDYDHTAAFVKNLDLVISVPQSVVHLAGAIGTEFWQLTPKRAMWQMGVYGEKMPWYKNHRNYWQNQKRDWRELIERVATDLSLWQKDAA